MPRCENCGSWISKHYMRVSMPDDRKAPKTCPNCPLSLSEPRRRVSQHHKGDA